MKAFWHNFVNVATGRWAISLPSAATCLPFCYFFALERESALNSGSFGTQIMIVSAGQLMSLLYLFIAQGIMLPSRKHRKQSLALCLFVWFSTGIVAGLISEFYAHFVLDTESYLATRISSSAATTGLCLALVAYWFGSLHKLRVEKEALSLLEAFLVEDSIKLIEDQRVTREVAIESLQETLLPRVLQLQNLTSGLLKSASSDSSVVALNELDARVQELLRSVKSYVSSISNSTSFSENLPREKISPVKLMSGLFPRNISVGASFILLILGAMIAQGSRNGLVGVLVGIFSSVIITALLFTLSKFGRRINGLQTSWFNSLVFSTVIFVQYFYAMTIQNELANPYQPWYSALKTFCGVYLASLLSTIAAEQSEFVDKLGTKSAIRRDEVERMSSSQENIQQLTSTTIFGAIQGQISGVIMALNVLTDSYGKISSKGDFSKFIRDANSLVENAISEIQQVGIKVHSR